MHTSDSRIASSLPEMTCATLSTTASKRSAKDVMLCAAVRCRAIAGRLLAQVGLRSVAVRFALAVDIGGTKVAAGIVTADGELVRSATAATPGDDLFGRLRSVIDEVRAGGDE